MSSSIRLLARVARFASTAACLGALMAYPARVHAQETTVALSPNDTYLRLDAQNYSAARTLTAYTWPDRMVANAILLKFNLSGLPAGAVVTSARLEMMLIGTDSNAADYRIGAHRILNGNPKPKYATGYTSDGAQPWTPSSATYEGIPMAQADIGPAEDTQSINRKKEVKAWTLTEMVQAWIADPSRNFGVLLNADTTAPKDRYRIFASSEHNTKVQRPVLRITYISGDSQPPSVAITSPGSGATLSQMASLAATATDNTGVAAVEFRLNGQPITGDVPAPFSTSWNTATISDGTYTLTAQARDLAGNTAVSSGVSVTIRNGYLILEPEDTSLHLDAASHAEDALLRTYTWPDSQPANAALLKFDLSFLPPGAVIDEAQLHLALVQSDAVNATYRIGAHRVVNRNPRIALATGLTADGVLPWTPSILAFDGVPLAQSDIMPAESRPAIDRSIGYKAWTVTNMVRDWVASPSANFGVLLNADATVPKDRYRYFASMEHENAALRPYLRVMVSGDTGSSIPAPSSDTTAPTVSLTAPASGATVSGNVTLSATASDNVGVASVRFRVDGVLLEEDTTAPFSVTWNSSGVPDGSHTITAVARDAAGNAKTSAGVTVTVSNGTSAPSSPLGSGVASLYPGDVGIEADPSVIFVERFDQSSLSAVLGNWTDVRNSSVMSLTTDVPPGSPGGKSLNIPSTSGGSGGHLYRQIAPGVNDTIYVRYYVKHPSSGNYTHSGVWVGGNNPATSWPTPVAGLKPVGNDRFIAAAEHNPAKGKFDHYNYWMNMRQSGDGSYWGNELLDNYNVRAPGGQWMCVEQMIKLNNPVSASNGEHAIWLDGVKVSHLGQGFPNGRWTGGIFTQDPTGSPFEGFRWRSDANLNLNWIWLQNYVGNQTDTFNMLFDHLVVATAYIGCLGAPESAPTSSTTDATLPTVSISAPSSGATVSGTTTVSANASDDVGVAGVQFRLNGSNLGAEDTTAPYSVSWNTGQVANGTHTLTAVARDTSGNLRTSASVSVTVSNASEPTSGGGVVFRSNWSSGTGTSANAVTDGNRWPNYWEFNGGTNIQLMSVVSGGPNGHNALRVEQRGERAANLQVDNFVAPSQDYYLRFYMKNEDTSGAGDHVVTVDTWQYANLTFVRKASSSTGWKLTMSAYGCGYTYPIGHWTPTNKLANGQWYRFEYHVDFVNSTRVQVHPRVYDAAGNLVLSAADFRQSDPGSASWNGRSDWTLESYYAAGHSFCVDPAWMNDFGLGNNGQQGATDTRLAWYFAAVELRTDRWPGPVGAAGSAMTAPGFSPVPASELSAPVLSAMAGLFSGGFSAPPPALAGRRRRFRQAP